MEQGKNNYYYPEAKRGAKVNVWKIQKHIDEIMGEAHYFVSHCKVRAEAGGLVLESEATVKTPGPPESRTLPLKAAYIGKDSKLRSSD